MVVDAKRYSEDDLMVAIDAGAEDIALDDDVYEIVCEPSDLTAVRDALERPGSRSRRPRSPSSRRPACRSTRTAPASCCGSIDALEDQDDVDTVHANFDVDAEVLERVAG